MSKARLEISLPRPRPPGVPGWLPPHPTCTPQRRAGAGRPARLRRGGGAGRHAPAAPSVRVVPRRRKEAFPRCGLRASSALPGAAPGDAPLIARPRRLRAGTDCDRSARRRRPGDIEVSPAAAPTRAHLRRAGRGHWRLVLFSFRMGFPK